VPLQCDEPANFRTFRLGLFGLDKLRNIDRTVTTLEAAFDRIGARVAHNSAHETNRKTADADR